MPCGFFYLSSSFLFPRLISAVTDWMYTILPHMVWPYSANLRCRCETCCTRLVENRVRKIAKNSPSAHHRTTLSGYIFATKALSTIRKNLLSSDISSTCPHNMVNFGPLAADIGSLVWVPSKFQRVSRLGSVTARHSSSGRQPNCGVEQEGATYMRQGGHHVGHWPTSS